jgi:hypothetical protein
VPTVRLNCAGRRGARDGSGEDEGPLAEGIEVNAMKVR